MHLSCLPEVSDLFNPLNDIQLMAPTALSGAMKGLYKSTNVFMSDGQDVVYEIYVLPEPKSIIF
jgi:hypothetical protein